MNRMGMEDGTVRAGKSNRRDITDRKDRTGGKKGQAEETGRTEKGRPKQ